MSVKKVTKAVEEAIKTWDDDRLLVLFNLMTTRIDIGTKFITDDDNQITHQVLVISAGDKYLVSDPRKLDWPLQPVGLPEGTPVN